MLSVAMLNKYLKVFGVSKDEWLEISLDELRRKYLELAKKCHPDRCKAKGAEEKFKLLQEAYECLKDKGNVNVATSKAVPRKPKGMKGKKASRKNPGREPRYQSNPLMDEIENAVYDFAEQLAGTFVSGVASWFMGTGKGRR